MNTKNHAPDWKGDSHRAPYSKINNVIDPRRRIAYTDRTGQVRHQKPTQQQIDALHYIAQGYSERQAKLKAGYALKTVDHPHFMKQPIIQAMISSVYGRLIKVGVTDEVIAAKFAEWLDAQKKVRNREGKVIDQDPDYDTQLKAYDRIKSMSETFEGGQGKGVKRRITLEDFVGGGTASDDTGI